jgi:hypothetical protein
LGSLDAVWSNEPKRLPTVLSADSLVATMKKPFDAFAEGLGFTNSRGGKTAVELFRPDLARWDPIPGKHLKAWGRNGARFHPFRVSFGP